jgi:hypothetical protein
MSFASLSEELLKLKDDSESNDGGNETSQVKSLSSSQLERHLNGMVVSYWVVSHGPDIIERLEENVYSLREDDVFSLLKDCVQ